MLRGEAARPVGKRHAKRSPPADATTRSRADRSRAHPDTDPEFLIERVAKLPTRQELALRPLYTMVGAAAIVVAWIELFWRHCM
jgi:hypothetical protein